MNLLPAFFIGILCGAMAGWKAHQSGQNVLFWSTIGLFFGIPGLALFVLYLAYKKRSRSRSTSISPSKKQKPASSNTVAEKAPLLTTPLRSDDWYFVDQERQAQGPFPVRVLQDLFSEGTLSSTALIWHPSFERWHPLEEISTLWEPNS